MRHLGFVLFLLYFAAPAVGSGPVRIGVVVRLGVKNVFHFDRTGHIQLPANGGSEVFVSFETHARGAAEEIEYLRMMAEDRTRPRGERQAAAQLITWFESPDRQRLGNPFRFLIGTLSGLREAIARNPPGLELARETQFYVNVDLRTHEISILIPFLVRGSPRMMFEPAHLLGEPCYRTYSGVFGS